MKTTQEAPKRSYSLFWLALVMLLSGVTVNLIYFTDFMLRSLGLLLLLVGVILIRASNVRGLMGVRVTSDAYASSRVSKRPRPFAWIVSGISVGGSIVFYICMLQSQRAGGYEVWPVYAFGLCAFVATLACGYLFAKLFRF